MIRIENVSITPIEPAIRGMRNSWNSWDKTDYGGSIDMSLMTKLSKAGPSHRKFMRMIVVYLDIIAPLYWWKEFDTYKVGTVANSCSTMHTIAERPFTFDDFSAEKLIFSRSMSTLDDVISSLNYWRDIYLNGGEVVLGNGNTLEFDKKDKNVWWQLIQLLPSSYNQRRTVMLNYEVLASIYDQRRFHKLDEWRDFCAWIESLPYQKIITGWEVNDDVGAFAGSPAAESIAQPVLRETANMKVYENEIEKQIRKTLYSSLGLQYGSF